MQSKVGKINEYDKNIAVNKNDQQWIKCNTEQWTVGVTY